MCLVINQNYYIVWKLGYLLGLVLKVLKIQLGFNKIYLQIIEYLQKILINKEKSESSSLVKAAIE